MEREPMDSPRKTATARSRSRARGDTWQAEKSLMTRNAILEATLQCLVDIGYAQTTTEKIVRQAGVSRGAMTHHFKSRAEVFDAAAKYIIERRAEEYDRMIGAVSVGPGRLPTLQDMKATMAILQKYYASPTYISLNELMRGARTDAEFRRTMVPLEKTLDKKISDSMLKHFPYLSAVEETREVLMDLILSSLQSIAVDMAPHLKGARLQRLLDLLSAVATREIDSAYKTAMGGKTPRLIKAKTTQPEGDVA
jgi:AcrR family transcriptional regulator